MGTNGIDQWKRTKRADDAARRESESSAMRESLRTEKPQAGDRDQQAVTSHHDRISGDRVHSQKPEKRHGGRIVADADAHERSKCEIARDRNSETPTGQPHGTAGRRRNAEVREQKKSGSDEERHTHEDLNRPLRQTTDDIGPDPGAHRRADDHAK